MCKIRMTEKTKLCNAPRSLKTMIYIICTLFIYYFASLSYLSKARLTSLYLIPIIAFSLVSIFRGDVGTDTAMYQTIASRITNNEAIIGVEPAFHFLLYLINKGTADPTLTIRIISFLFSLFLLFLFKISNQNWRFFLYFYFIPAYYFNYSMNGLRIGIASLLIIYSLILLYEKKFKSISAAFLSVLFHYSSLLLLALIQISSRRLITKTNLKLLFIGLIVCATILYLKQDYFLFKLQSYANFSSPGLLSGTRNIIIIIVFLLGIITCNMHVNDKLKFISITLVSTILAWILARYTYAGLRVLDLICLATPLIIVLYYEQKRIALPTSLKLSFTIAGLLSAAAMINGFYKDQGLGPSPFLPYKTLFLTIHPL